MNLKTPKQARNDGSALTKENIEQLKSSIKGTLVTKADASEADYNAAVERWNKIYVKQAVRDPSTLWVAAPSKSDHDAPLLDACSLRGRRRRCCQIHQVCREA